MSTELNSGNPGNAGAASPEPTIVLSRGQAAGGPEAKTVGKAVFAISGLGARSFESLPRKISVGVTPELDAMIDKMAEELEETKAMTILRALALLKAALNAKAQGERLMIVNETEDSERELEF